MSDSDNFKEEVLQAHASLIHRVVMHCNEPGSVPDLTAILQQAEDSDWKQLVTTIRSIISGNRDDSILQALDEEEAIIIGSILCGLEDPGTLPALQPDFQSSLTTTGIANLIHASREGSAHSLNIIANLARQMLEIGDDFEIMAGHIRPMIEGERDLARLTENMTEKGQKMMVGILAELAKLEAAHTQTE